MPVIEGVEFPNVPPRQQQGPAAPPSPPSWDWWQQQASTPAPTPRRVVRVYRQGQRPRTVAPAPQVERPAAVPPPPPPAPVYAPRTSFADQWREQTLQRVMPQRPSAVTYTSFSARPYSVSSINEALQVGQRQGQEFLSGFDAPDWLPDWLEGGLQQGVNWLADRVKEQEKWSTEHKTAQEQQRAAQIRASEQAGDWRFGARIAAYEDRNRLAAEMGTSFAGVDPAIFGGPLAFDPSVVSWLDWRSKLTPQSSLIPPNDRILKVENAYRRLYGMPELAVSVPPPLDVKLANDAAAAVQRWSQGKGAFGSNLALASQDVQNAFKNQGTLTGIMSIAGVPYTTMVEPFVADWYQNVWTPYKQVFSATMDNALVQLPQQGPEWARQISAAGEAADATFSRLFARAPQYATAEEVQKWRMVAPWYTQLGFGLVGDPLNVVGWGMTKAARSASLRRAARYTAPLAETVETVGKSMMSPYTPGWTDKLPFMGVTADSKAAGLIDTAIDTVNVMKNIVPVPPGQTPGQALLPVFSQWIMNPDDPALVARTGGFSASLPSKQTVALVREMIGTTDGAPNLQNLERIIDVSGNDVEAVAKLAQRFDDAARVWFPEAKPGDVTRIRNATYKILNAAYIGWNPGILGPNIFTNLSSTLVDGWNPFSRSSTRARWWNEWGAMPAPAKQGVGPGGEVWKSGRKTTQYLASLDKPSRLRDMWRPIFKEGGWKLPVATLNSEIESAFSERTVYDAIRWAYDGQWRRTLDDLEPRLAAVVGERDARLLARRLRNTVNETQARKVLDDYLAQAPPPGGPPGPAAPGPAVPAAPGPAVPAAPGPAVPAAPGPAVPAAPGPAVLAPLAGPEWTPTTGAGTFPGEVVQQLDDILPGSGRAVAEAVENTPPAGRQAAVDSALVPVEMDAEIANAERRLMDWVETMPDTAAIGAGATREAVEQAARDTIRHLDEVEAILNEQILARERELSKIIDAANAGLDREVVSQHWAEFWNKSRQEMFKTFGLGQAAIEEFVDRAKLGAPGERLVKNYRMWFDDTWETWETYRKRLAETWRQSEELRAVKATSAAHGQSLRDARNQLWREFRTWRQEHWNAYQARRNQYALERTSITMDVMDEIAKRYQLPPPPPPPPPPSDGGGGAAVAIRPEAPRAGPGGVMPEAPRPAPPPPIEPLTWEQRVATAKQRLRRDVLLTQKQRDLLALEEPGAIVWWYEEGPRGSYRISEQQFKEFRTAARRNGKRLAPQPAPRAHAADVSPPAPAPVVASVVPPPAPVVERNLDDAVEALGALGFNKAEARARLAGLPDDVTDVESQVRYALSGKTEAPPPAAAPEAPPPAAAPEAPPPAAAPEAPPPAAEPTNVLFNKELHDEATREISDVTAGALERYLGEEAPPPAAVPEVSEDVLLQQENNALRAKMLRDEIKPFSTKETRKLEGFLPEKYSANVYYAEWKNDVLPTKGIIVTAPDGNRLVLQVDFDSYPIRVRFVEAERKGTGIGTEVFNALKKYADESGKPLQIYQVTNRKFYEKFSWLKDTGSQTFTYTPAATPEAPPAVARVRYTENTRQVRDEINALAKEAGLPTATKDGRPLYVVMRNEIKKYIPDATLPVKGNIDPLEALTPDQLGRLADRLEQRAADLAKVKEIPEINLADAFRDMEEAAVEGEIMMNAKWKPGDSVMYGGRKYKVAEVVGADVETEMPLYKLEGYPSAVREEHVSKVRRGFREAPAPEAPPPAAAPEAPLPVKFGIKGKVTSSFGIKKADQRYQMHYEVVELDDLIPSHLDDLETLNPVYDPKLQERVRSRLASKDQIYNMSRQMDWERMYTDVRAIDRGTPILGPADNMVESGNGRVLAMRQVRDSSPELWEAGQDWLRNHAEDYGFKPADLDDIKDPVLVRRRTEDIDRYEFASDANARDKLAMSPYEQAASWAKSFGTDQLLPIFEVSDDQTVYGMLMAEKNRALRMAFLDNLSKEDRAAYLLAGGELNQDGLKALKNTLFATIYPGPEGERLALRLTEDISETGKAIESAIYGSLSDAALTKRRIAEASLDPMYDATEPIARAANQFLDLRAEGRNVRQYIYEWDHPPVDEVGTVSMFPSTNKPPEEYLDLLDEFSRKPAQLRKIVKDYYQRVNVLPPAETLAPQMDLGGVPKLEYPGPAEIMDEIIQDVRIHGTKGPPKETQERMFEFAVPAQGRVVPRKVRDPRAPGFQNHPYSPDPYDSLSGFRKLQARTRQWLADPFYQRRSMATVDEGALRQLWDSEVLPRQTRSKATAGKFATEERHFAYGNYAKQRDIHEMLRWLYMYPTFYGFSARNWAIRAAKNPAIMSNYARYRRLVWDMNQQEYRQQVGDPNAQMPASWDGYVKFPFFGGDAYARVERLLNPLYSMYYDYSNRARREAPGGGVVEALSGWGPGLYSPLLWAYAAALKAAGYDEAAQQWVGYIFPQSRAIKAGTALLREAVPSTASVIPPGGVNVEQLWNPNVKGGDIYERSQIAYFLWDMWRKGEISEREFQDTSYRQSGPAWEKAKQMQAASRAPGTLMSFLTGLGFRRRDEMDFMLSRMYEQMNGVYALRNQVNAEAYRAAWDKFDRQYPYASAIRMARTFDDSERLNDYTWMVLRRYGPGWKKQTFLNEIDPGNLVGKFYRTGGIRWDGTEPWTQAEVDNLEVVIAEMARRMDVPTPDQVEDWDQAKYAEQQIDRRALDAINSSPGGTRYTLEEMQDMQREYYRLEEIDPVAAKLYLRQHPELTQWWDAQNQLQKQLDAGKWMVLDPYADMPDNLMARQYQEAAKLNRSPTEAAFNEGLILPGDNWRQELVALGIAIPAAFWNLQDYEWRSRASQADIELAAKDVEAWLQTLPQAFRDKWLNPENMRVAKEADKRLKEQILPGLFGQQFVDWYYSAYVKMTPDERKAFRNANPDVAKKLYAMYDLMDAYGKENPIWALYYGMLEAAAGGGAGAGRGAGRSSGRRYYPRSSRRYYRRSYYGGGGGGGYGGGVFPGATPTTTTPTLGTFPTATPISLEQYNQLLTNARSDPSFDPLAKLLFGSDIFNLADQWYTLTQEADKLAWAQYDEQRWQRLIRFLQWLASGGSQNATIGLQSAPPGTGSPAVGLSVPSPLPSR